MKKVLLGVGSLLVLGVCFIVAKTLVQPSVQSGVGWYELPPETRDTLLTEAAESGVNPAAMAKVADDLEQSLNSRETLAALKVAYADVSGSDEQIARQLDADPDRRNQVGYAIEALILESSDLPIRLDEMTLYTGAHYEESGATIVYHYDIEQDLSWMSQSEVDAVGLQIEQINPNAVCEISLSILAQGFDIAYRYRDANGSELFRVTRTYSFCKSLGY